MSLGAHIGGENPQYRNGAISAYLPISMIEALGGSRGVNNLALGYKPILNVGSVISQGAKVMNSDKVNNSGFKGDGITVGVLSDSFDWNHAITTYAKDVATGDLPVLKVNRDDYTSGTDEGRAMAQIVHDVAPGASIAFHTAYLSEPDFAKGIIDLAGARSA